MNNTTFWDNMKRETFLNKMCNLNFSRLTTEQVKISETKLNVYTLCTVESRLLSQSGPA